MAPPVRAGRHAFRPRHCSQPGRCTNSRRPREFASIRWPSEEALAAIDAALQRSPFPPNWFWRVRGGILLELTRYREAVEAFDNMPQKDHFAWLQLAAAQAHLGHQSLAMQALTKARELRPSISVRELIAVIPHARREPLDPLLDGLRKVGLAEKRNLFSLNF